MYTDFVVLFTQCSPYNARWQAFSLLVRGTIRYLNAKLLMETVEQISIPLATAFNLSLKEGVFPFEWKKQTSYQYLKMVREISQIITDQ